jgi:hypothetical protein
MLKYLILTLAFSFGCDELRDQESTQSAIQVTQKQGKADNANACACPQEPQPQESSITYFNQYDNTLHPGSSCQNTSVAMLLSKFGWWGKPDDITREWGKDYAQSPSGLANMFNELAAQNGISKRLTPITNGSLEEFRELLRQGKPTIVHGYFTSYGHVLVALDFDGTHYTVNDPAGCWTEQFKGGYDWCPIGKTGEHIKYTKEAFEAAIATSNGWNYLPLWFHKLK